jgi:hypothetical protein
MRDKFVFIPSTETKRHDLQRLKDEELRVRDELVAVAFDIFKRHKSSSKGREDTALSTMTGSFGRGDNHTVLWNYEKAHLAAGEDWAAVSTELKQVVDGQQRRRILVHEFLKSFDDHNRGTAQLEGVVDQARRVYVKLGTVFLGDARFTELRPQPKDVKNTVYVLGRVMNDKLVQDPNHTSSHFVWLPNSKTYVRRFVVRGLNHNDIVNVKNAAPLGAPVQTVQAQRREVVGPKQTTRHNVAENTRLSEIQQIISHTRGWQKRYISTGVSSRPVYSTRGTQFISLYGTAVIDLAKVDLKNVWDVHSPIAVRKVMGWDANTVVTAGGSGAGARSLREEEFLALRDVLRTRELLIKFQVPYAALHCQPNGSRIIGIGAGAYGGPERFVAALRRWPAGWAKVKDYDALNYAGFNGRYWLFLLFANDTDAQWFWDRVRLHDVKEWLRLTRYEMPMSLEGWK